MFNEEVRAMLAQVITSWQVLAVTVVLIIYISLVKYVARIRDRPKRSKPKRKRKIPKPNFSSAPEIVSGDDELGLEDTAKS